MLPYSGAVQIGSAAPIGDLYRYLNVDLISTAVSNFQGYFWAPDSLTFRADTDSLMYNIAPVPEAATMLLLVTCLVGSRLRKKKK